MEKKAGDATCHVGIWDHAVHFLPDQTAEQHQRCQSPYHFGMKSQEGKELVYFLFIYV